MAQSTAQIRVESEASEFAAIHTTLLSTAGSERTLPRSPDLLKIFESLEIVFFF